MDIFKKMEIAEKDKIEKLLLNIDKFIWDCNSKGWTKSKNKKVISLYKKTLEEIKKNEKYDWLYVPIKSQIYKFADHDLKSDIFLWFSHTKILCGYTYLKDKWNF
ncbi:hypothetical protein [Mycoplasmopsis fermentans]|nr:hypothetical protein [Mycoplasmopsis fermentans]YP_044794.1 hypothetical protein [Mycoplasma phage phiMFV1]VEU67064.1 Uncharacterised protein [Mesomycoplasma conjunctivae]AAT65023.1 hypothetical protein [Mycoplasma phage phiMFV1]AAT65062.1 hypothetical protein [Mycoplasma phage phiMFV1]ADV34932.1 Hypothetical Protein MfeM64YM_0937 [Mycoplasmopsis fermentans M64]RMX34459.1 hypothetical protein MFI2_0857 [Mycoplasmopsis fermentans MF-I2]